MGLISSKEILNNNCEEENNNKIIDIILNNALHIKIFNIIASFIEYDINYQKKIINYIETSHDKNYIKIIFTNFTNFSSFDVCICNIFEKTINNYIDAFIKNNAELSEFNCNCNKIKELIVNFFVDIIPKKITIGKLNGYTLSYDFSVINYFPLAKVYLCLKK